MATLKHSYSTYGNHGQFTQESDFVQQGGDFVRCDSVEGAAVTDHSTRSRKNTYESIEAAVELPAGTLGYTDRSGASSSNSTRSRTYWRLTESGDRQTVEHKRLTENSERVAVTVDLLADGERVPVSRAPRGVRLNAYKGRCECGRFVPEEAGELVKVNGAWGVRCVECFLASR